MVNIAVRLEDYPMIRAYVNSLLREIEDLKNKEIKKTYGHR